MSDNRLQRKATRILHRNNAQEIKKALADLEEHRSEFATRWLWELIQNARDFPDESRPMTIRVTVSPKQITFAHNGRDFTEEEILSLILHGSTKQSNPEQLGKFGSGFLSTHLISKKVRIKGTLRDDDGVRKGFEFELDRSGESAEAIGAAMQSSLDALIQILDQKRFKPTDWTEYVYQADGSLDAGELETDFPFDAVPYILVFDNNVDAIELRLQDKRYSYTRAGTEELDAGGYVTVIEGIDSSDRFFVVEEDGIWAAVPVSEREDEGYELWLPGDVPRLFKFLPLVNSVTLGLPAVFHSPLFATTENRDGLVFSAGGPNSDVNKGLLTKAAACFLLLARNCAEEGFDDLHLLLNVSEVSDFPAWLEDRPWYADWQRSLIRQFAAIPLVRMENGDPEPASDAHLPLGDATMTWESVYRLGTNLAEAWAPAAAVAEGCSVVAAAWIGLLGDNDPLIESCVLTPERLIANVKEIGSLKNLGERLELERAETIAWLNGLISAVAEPHRATCLDGLIPDQTPEGTFRSSVELSRDTEIDDDLKNVLETLDDPIRKRLVHEDIIGAESIIKRVQPREPLVSNAKDRLKRQAQATSDAPEYRAACLTMFQWLAVEGRWDDLKDGIPVYTLDNDESEMVSKTSSRGTLLAPRELWPDEARPYWDAFPRGSVLSDDYAPLLDSSSWSEAAANGVLVIELLSSEDQELAELENYMLALELEGYGHSAAAPVEVGKLAFIGTEFQEALRSRERAVRFLQFILDYVIGADKSWKKRVAVECECGAEHEIIPCQWLAFIREREWVPRSKVQERLTDVSLARLTRHDPRLADAVTSEEHTDFLTLIGINVLEQAVLAAGESQSTELRRRLAQLARLAAQHPGAVARLIEDIEAHHEADQRWRQNQKLGKIVEELIGARLKSRLLLLRMRVKPQFKGYDLGAYVDEASYADVGWIEMQQAETLVAKIEIKATRGGSVSMSNRQGEEASGDQARFWLCVVPLDANEDIDELTPERVEELARFVSSIGNRLAPAREGIQEAVESADKSGFDLEHVDDIRYGIRSEVWESEAVSLTDFVDWIKQLPAMRR
ncbi:ATP-binding protein [Bradyrhizobium sp. SRS-191]|uniref:ATP-binding protein n=1 Tax=Bradyrhizobium sp. SRS-191 TaxID=2962606 RepID=UPI00211E747A|nr:ATP-binding protein [Bradyrhizobium sp. SRS-191]